MGTGTMSSLRPTVRNTTGGRDIRQLGGGTAQYGLPLQKEIITWLKVYVHGNATLE